MTVARLQEMFERVVVDKNAEAILEYYHPDFRLTSNGMTQGYDAFLAEHVKVYATPIQYSVEYDPDAWVESNGDSTEGGGGTPDRVAGRVWITTSRPGEAPTRIEVILIAEFKAGRLTRLWETTWPNWSQLPAFEDYVGESS